MLMWSLILLLRNHALTGISFGFGFFACAYQFSKFAMDLAKTI